MSDKEWGLVHALQDRLDFATRRYEDALELAESLRISMERAREDLIAEQRKASGLGEDTT